MQESNTKRKQKNLPLKTPKNLGHTLNVHPLRLFGMFQDVLRCFEMFRDVSGFFGRLVATNPNPIRRKQPIHKEKFLHYKNIAKNSGSNVPNAIRQRITLFLFRMFLELLCMLTACDFFCFIPRLSNCVNLCEIMSKNV